MNVLIADKNKVVRKVLSSSVEHYFDTSKGKKVKLFEAQNGEEAMKTMVDNQIDIVLLDSKLPKTKRGEVIDVVRSDRRWNKTRIIVATEEPSREKVIKLIQKGVNGCIVKPFDKETVFKTLNSVTSRMLNS